MGSKTDTAVRGFNMTLRLVISAIWGAIAVGAFSTGIWWFGLFAIAYLVYLWVFGGSWLIY